MPARTKTPDYAGHKLRWKGCTRCSLSETRCNTVLFRGSIPCDILFIGEAPGASEDALGKPFIGPAGRTAPVSLDRTIQAAGVPLGRCGFTNLLACLPVDPETGKKVNSPSKFPDAINNCAPRLREVYDMTTPSLVVFVGRDAEKYVPRMLGDYRTPPATCAIIHPGAILRMDISQKGLAFQRNVVTLRDAYEALVPSS